MPGVVGELSELNPIISLAGSERAVRLLPGGRRQSLVDASQLIRWQSGDRGSARGRKPELDGVLNEMHGAIGEQEVAASAVVAERMVSIICGSSFKKVLVTARSRRSSF